MRQAAPLRAEKPPVVIVERTETSAIWKVLESILVVCALIIAGILVLVFLGHGSLLGRSPCGACDGQTNVNIIRCPDGTDQPLPTIPAGTKNFNLIEFCGKAAELKKKPTPAPPTVKKPAAPTKSPAPPKAPVAPAVTSFFPPPLPEPPTPDIAPADVPTASRNPPQPPSPVYEPLTPRPPVPPPDCRYVRGRC